MNKTTTTDPIYYTTAKSALEKMGGKYVGSIVHNGASDLDAIAETICAERPYLDEPTVKMVIRALAAEIRREVGENVRYVTTGTAVAFTPAISGSVASMDGTLTKGENEMYVNMMTLDKLRRVIEQIVPHRADEGPAKVIIDKIEDSGTGACGEISGTSDFVVTGYNISASHDGESLTLVNAAGERVATATVKGEDGMGQRIEAALTTAPEPGSYTLRLISRGYKTPTDELGTYDRKVEVCA